MKTIAFPLLFIFVLFSGVFNSVICGASDNSKELRVGSELDFPPYASQDKNGEPIGFSIDLIRAVAQAMGVSLKISTGTWDSVWQELVTKELDVLPIVAQSPERKKLVDFSLPHTETYDAFFVKKGNPNIESIAAAQSMKIVVMRSDAAHHELLARNFEKNLTLVDTIPDGLALIASGKHDAFLCSKLIGTLLIKEKGLKGLSIGPPIQDYKRIFSFAVKKGNTELLEKLNQGLLIVKTNGVYGRIYNKWLLVADPWRKVRKLIFPAIITLVAIILIAAVWVASLQRIVKKLNIEITNRKGTEENLRESEERFRKLFESSPLSTFVWDVKDGQFFLKEINNAADILTYGKGVEFLGISADKIYPDRPDILKQFVDCITEKKNIVFNTEYLSRATGLKRQIIFTFVYISNEILMLHAEDITEPKQAEEILHKSNEMLKRTEAMANIGSWEWDVQSDRAYWSEELFRIFGRDPAEGAPSFTEQSKFYANGDIQRLRDAVEICVKRGTPYEIELGAVRIDGEIRHCISRGQPQYDENEKVFRVAGSFQDITDRKHSENHIKSLERRNQALLDHSPVCHKIVDLDFNLKYMSANGFKMLKLDENMEVYGKPYPFYFYREAFQNEMRKKLKKVIDTGESITMEAPTNDFQGNEIWLESSLIPVFDDDYNIEYLTVVSANVTQRKHDEKDKTRLEGQLRQAQKMEAVGRLAGGVAHDFNNMLSVIIGYAGMAMEDVDLSQPLYKRLEEIRRAGERSADLTRQLLAFARKQAVSPKVLDLNKTVVNMTSMLHRLIGENIDLAWLPGENVWPVKVDPSQIDQILANLCVNARDAIADVGRITIETGNFVLDDEYCADHLGFNPGEYVFLTVSDDGCGMDSELRDNIFEPFFTTKGGRGTGLGLATVYGVVKQNKGFINVYSEPGQGTIFKIYLPRYRSKAEVIPDEVKNLPTKLGHETILLVEDEIAILTMTAQMLENLGYQVITARTPGEAIRLSQEHADEIHLLVTDVVMPEMNGRDLTKNILSICPNLKHLFMSGYTANVIAHHGILDEGVNFIQKPFSREQLGVKLREMLDGGEV